MDRTFERIDQLMRDQRKQKQQLNEYLGVGRSTYENWRKGSSKTYFQHLDKIAQFLSVSPNYLISGEESNEQQATANYSAEKELVSLFRKMSIINQDLLLNLARTIPIST